MQKDDDLFLTVACLVGALVVGIFMPLILPVAEALLMFAGFFCLGRLSWHMLWRGHIRREVKKFRKELDVGALV